MDQDPQASGFRGFVALGVMGAPEGFPREEDLMEHLRRRNRFARS